MQLGLPGRRVDGVELANGLGLLFGVDLVVEVFFASEVLLLEFMREILFLRPPKMLLRSMLSRRVGVEGENCVQAGVLTTVRRMMVWEGTK
jgi:hypothetical protein